MNAAGVLSGVRVLDFGRYVAGPYCAALLAEFGADVIRIEKREGSEDRFPLPVTANGDGALFLQINRNKRGMTLDPQKPAGREIVRRLVASADVVVANLPEQALLAMGLDYDTLKSIKPDIVLTLATAYGRSGPYRDRVGFDAVGQALCGSSYLSADSEHDPPRRTAVPWVDFVTALHCAYGTALALLERQRNGRGQLVEATLLGAALAASNGLLIEQSATAKNRPPVGNRSHLGAPSDIFRARDGWVQVAVVGQPLYRRWAKLMGEPEWLTDPCFADDAARAAHAGPLSERMARWCALRSADEVVETLSAAMIPAAKVLTPQQALDDPHIRAAGFMQDVVFPGLDRPIPIARAAVSLSDAPSSIRDRPPLLGEHTDEILAELGFSADDIRVLRSDAVV